MKCRTLRENNITIKECMKRYKAILIFVLALVPCFLSGQHLGNAVTRLKQNVEYLTDSARLGRMAGSLQEMEIAHYLYNELTGMGVAMLSPEDGEDFYLAVQGDTIHSRNVIGIVEGYDPQLRNEYVVIGAHYDHLGTTVLTKDGSLSAHFEHTIVITPDGPQIMTKP